MHNTEENYTVRPGINPAVNLGYFSKDEREIIERISKDWYVTNEGSEIKLSKNSRYKYILIKPIEIFKQMFNLDREIVAIFSPYESFEPRTLDAITAATKRHQALRLERICSVLISKDVNVEVKLRELLKNDQEAQIVIPFTYAELLGSISDQYFFRNRFIKHFYSRDLFASESPLKKDIFFFGRTDLVHSLINRHRSHQVSGLFGLRKTGKTSIIFGIQRALEKVDGISGFIDCQSPAFHRLRWNQALYHVLSETCDQNQISHNIGTVAEYSEDQAPLLFEKHLVKMAHELGKRSFMLIFDEVENITPTVSPSDHWRSGLDFVYFWQAIRSLFQKRSDLFSYLLVGTNPLCVELPRINGADNPIFAQVPLEYLPGFDVPQTREMVRRLGKIMGLQFDEAIYGRLTDDFGGHPYLIRHVCSVVNKLSQNERPVRVDKSLYDQAVKTFLRDYNHFMEMILSVLKEFFPDEYEMLRMLARGDEATFKEFAALSPLYTNHLLGYGILQEVNGRYSFKIETIRLFMEAREKHKKLHLTDEEKWAEVSERRNVIEKKLRKVCRMQLKAQTGEATARTTVTALLGEPRASRVAGLAYVDLFDGNKSGIYFTDLIKIINKAWDCFKNVFGTNKDEWVRYLNCVNDLRIDAHAKDITEAEFQMFRISADRLETVLEAFLD